MTFEHRRKIPIRSERDILTIRGAVREAATSMHFRIPDVARIVTSASELARNVLRYAGFGFMLLNRINTDSNIGIELVFEDQGPGMANIEEAMKMGYTTSQGLGLGLPGVKRLMDEMEIQSKLGQGTTVKTRKWLKRRIMRENPKGV